MSPVAKNTESHEIAAGCVAARFHFGRGAPHCSWVPSLPALPLQKVVACARNLQHVESTSIVKGMQGLHALRLVAPCAKGMEYSGRSGTPKCSAASPNAGGYPKNSQRSKRRVWLHRPLPLQLERHQASLCGCLALGGGGGCCEVVYPVSDLVANVTCICCARSLANSLLTSCWRRP